MSRQKNNWNFALILNFTKECEHLRINIYFFIYSFKYFMKSPS